MAETKWTKGIWTARADSMAFVTVSEAATGKIVAQVPRHPDMPHRDNAHLIKAAPLLYEALERLVSFAESVEAKALVGDEGCLWPCEQARTALSAARGEEG